MKWLILLLFLSGCYSYPIAATQFFLTVNEIENAQKTND